MKPTKHSAKPTKPVAVPSHVSMLSVVATRRSFCQDQIDAARRAFAMHGDTVAKRFLDLAGLSY